MFAQRVRDTLTPGSPIEAKVVRYARPLLIAYGVLLAVVLLAPSSRVQSSLVVDTTKVLLALGPPEGWITYPRMEVFMNAVIIAPLSFIGSFAFPRSRWQDWTAYGFIGAVCVEMFQGIFLPGRQPAFSDMVANTAGACVGALLVFWARRVSRMLEEGR